MTVSTTDYWTAKALGPVGMLAVEVLGRRARDQELEVRRRRVEELKRPKPAPQRGEDPTVVVGGKVVSEGKTPSYPWRTELRMRATRPYRIVIESGAASRIRREVADVSHEDLETGGLTFGWRRPGATEAYITWVSGAGADGQLHGSRAMQLANEAAARAQMPEWLHGEAFKRVADWHYHPRAGSAVPSQADVDHWAHFLWRNERACLFTYPAVIVYRDGPGGPRLAGWVTHRVGQGGDATYVCEPCEVESF